MATSRVTGVNKNVGKNCRSGQKGIKRDNRIVNEVVVGRKRGEVGVWGKHTYGYLWNIQINSDDNCLLRKNLKYSEEEKKNLATNWGGMWKDYLMYDAVLVRGIKIK